MRRCLLVAVVVGLSACSGSTAPVAPTPPPAPLCQTQQTAEVTLVNHSAISATFDVLIDNIRRATIAPNQSAGPYAVSANATHTITARYTNTSLTACSASSSFAICSTQSLDCTK